MKSRELLKTNLLVCIILLLGFSVTAFFAYQANYKSSLDKIEQVSSLTTEGIYYQLSALFTKPVNISQTMAHDSLLVSHLTEESEHLEDEEYTGTIQNYLNTYKNKYNFDSVFLVSRGTGRYYNYHGVDRILTEGNPENDWYFNFINGTSEYSMNVDNDEVNGSENAITVFINCKVYDQENELIGVIGVGIRVDYLKEFLNSYEEKYDLNACLIDEEGIIQVSTSYTGYQKKDWFLVSDHEEIKEQLLDKSKSGMAAWTDKGKQLDGSYVVGRYIPELRWHLVVEQDKTETVQKIKYQLYQSIIIILLIIICVLLIITAVIRKFSRQIAQLTFERQEAFETATEQLYDNIYELNITKNCAANQKTELYFESLGAKNLPYSQSLCVIAEKQIKEEFREGYINIFTPENVVREYENGNDHLQYDFMITQDGGEYFWMRIDTYIFLCREDQCLHMFTYRKNISEDKKKELLAYTDEMTRFMTKTATKRRISKELLEHPEVPQALFIFDIDNFKQVNDTFGHSFGDFCIKEFTRMIRRNFQEQDILGRIGGDEFVAFITVQDDRCAEKKAEELTKALDFDCTDGEKSCRITASIGVSISPSDGTDFDTLYEKADLALYQTKQRGKNGFTIYSEN